MSDLSKDQIDWTKDFTGVDLALLAGKLPQAAQGYIDRFTAGVKQLLAPPAPPADKELAAKLKQLEDDIGAVEAQKFDVTRMRSDLDDLKTKADAAEKQTDEKARAKAIAAVKKRADEEIRHVGALAKSIKSAMGDSKDPPDDAKRSEIYKGAIKSLYKLDFDVPKGMTNTHFDRVFDMMGTVPEGDVKQDQLKHLVYNKKDIGGVYYPEDYEDRDDKTKKLIKKYKAGSIELGDFGDASKEEGYEIEGKKLQANSFDVTTLHEIGHSVDQKHGIMNKYQKDNGCGNWSDETTAKVAKAYLDELKAKTKLSDQAKDKALLAAITTTLDKGTITQPADIGDDDWQLVAQFLSDECIPMREDSNPFFNSNPVVVGDRVYTQSGGAWFSYAIASRKDTFVNNYQWRTPAEWFAEVYAITWLKKQKPPSKVPAGVAQHCWVG